MPALACKRTLGRPETWRVSDAGMRAGYIPIIRKRRRAGYSSTREKSLMQRKIVRCTKNSPAGFKTGHLL
jgi:hypothetical protein